MTSSAFNRVPQPRLTSIPSAIAAVADYVPYARERLDDNAWAYIASGAADEITFHANRAAFDALALNTRVLADVRGGNTALTLFGQRFAHPILLAPVAYQRLAHPDGELATVQAAAALETGMVVSTLASHTLEDIARHADAPLWFQLYVQPDRGFTRELVRRAEAAGYSALVVTVDAPIAGIRNREQRARFQLPEGIGAVNLRGMAAPAPVPGAASPVFDVLMAHAPAWKDIEDLRAFTRLPLIVKGLLHPEDASRAFAAGADGIVVSNHGGRTLDTLPASLAALPAIVAGVERMGMKGVILLDGGIYRGTDVIKALALGANAVLIGRAWIYGLAAAGALGVAHVLRLLRDELEIGMALTGAAHLSDLGKHLIHTRHNPET
ncbi:MAG: alpha-hydroxy-acid oxidizing protein [Azoarcus sp.]|nr:alpha-hydroxy-acid oxidizing protein [Azoarcus sp.]